MEGLQQLQHVAKRPRLDSESSCGSEAAFALSEKRGAEEPGSPMPKGVVFPWSNFRARLDNSGTTETLMAHDLVDARRSDDESTSASSTAILEKDTSEMSREELCALVETLRTRLRRNEVERKPAVLSPSMYSVEAPKSLRKLKLGRTASISTQMELKKLRTSSNFSMQEAENLPLHEHLRNMLAWDGLQREAMYCKSNLFADHLLELCDKACKVFEEESRLLRIESPVYVFGDLHGNFEDTQFFAENTWPMGMELTAGRFLFLGDYVDRGENGLEVLAYLLSQKIQLPDKVFLIRGNHETRQVNGWEEHYRDGSFIVQCRSRFGEEKGQKVWERCNDVFDRLPFAAIVDDSVFCVHGGIPSPCHKAGPNGEIIDIRLEKVRQIPCPINVRAPQEKNQQEMALAFGMLWADPADEDQEDNLQKSADGFGESARGESSYVFGNKAVQEFLEIYNLDYIIRAHEATANGVAVCKSAKVLTVFSTSKDHGCGVDAKCGCFLLDRSKIQAIIREPHYSTTTSERLHHLRS